MASESNCADCGYHIIQGSCSNPECPNCSVSWGEDPDGLDLDMQEFDDKISCLGDD